MPNRQGFTLFLTLLLHPDIDSVEWRKEWKRQKIASDAVAL